MAIPETVNVRFSSFSGGQLGHGWSLSIFDPNGCQILDIEMSYEHFGQLLAAREVEAIVRRLSTENIGKVGQNKTEVVPVNKSGSVDEAHRQEALAPFEVDGWAADRDDFGNIHRRQGYGYRVRFFRYVDPTTEASD